MGARKNRVISLDLIPTVDYSGPHEYLCSIYPNT